MTTRAGSSPSWLLDESRTIGRENVDAAHVARYDEKEDADAHAEVARLRSWVSSPNATVVDLGAGTGQFSLAAAEAFARVVAVDPSPVMLDRLRGKARAAGASVETVQAGFLTYEHAGEPPDVVYSRYALHHLPDFWKAVALGRTRALLPRGGVFRLWDIVYDFGVAETTERIEWWCASLEDAGSPGEWTRADLEEHVRDEHSTYAWLLEPMIEQAGFEIEEAIYSDDRFFARYLLRAA
jgi:SAM-dependent methyltransferase